MGVAVFEVAPARLFNSIDNDSWNTEFIMACIAT